MFNYLIVCVYNCAVTWGKVQLHFLFFFQGALANQVRSTTGEFLIVSEHLHLNVTVLCHVSIQAPVSVSANQLADILPAKILVQRKTISENNDLYVTCSTVGFKKQNQVYVYLCQNDVGLRKQLQKHDNDDSIFIIKRVGLHHSGNYSCVFSSTEYEPHQVAMRGDNVIQIQVIGKDFHSFESFVNLSSLHSFHPPAAQPIMSLQIFQWPGRPLSARERTLSSDVVFLPACKHLMNVSSSTPT